MTEVLGGMRTSRALDMAGTWGGPSQRTEETWGDSIRAYERRRHEVSPGIMASPGGRVKRGQIACDQRGFDPLKQTYRDEQRDQQLRDMECAAAVEHSNRATDIQILREQPFNVVSNASRTRATEALVSPYLRKTRQKPSKAGDISLSDHVVGRVGYNIVSNLGFDQHHWAPPDERPPAPMQRPRVREIPGFTTRDHNILSGRYLENHEALTARDLEIAKLESTVKIREQSKFDPVTQQYNVAENEARAQRAEAGHAKELEVNQACMHPPVVKTRPQAYYDLMNGQIRTSEDAQALRTIDLAEDERKERFRTRHQVEHDLQERDEWETNRDMTRSLNRMHHDRFKIPLVRGHDIITNRHQTGRAGLPPFRPAKEPEVSPWERTQALSARTATFETSPQRQRGSSTPHASPAGQRGSYTARTPHTSPFQGQGTVKLGATASAAGGRVLPAGPAPEAPALGGPEASPVYSRARAV